MLVDGSDSLQLGRSSFLQSHSNYNRNQGISDAIQKRNEKKTSEITTFHAPGDSIAYLVPFFLVLEAIFHACEGTIGRNGPEIAEKLVELKEVNLVLWLSVGLWLGWLAMSSREGLM